jgi:hypothetical protein
MAEFCKIQNRSKHYLHQKIINSVTFVNSVLMCPHNNKAFHHFGGQYQVHDPYIRIHLYTSISHFMNDLCPVAFTICEFLTMTKFSLQFECVVINFQSHILKDPIFHAPKRILSCFPLHDQFTSHVHTEVSTHLEGM